jgi:hypothetical protein
MSWEVTDDVRQKCRHCHGTLTISRVEKRGDGSRLWSLSCRVCHKPGGSFSHRPNPIHGKSKSGHSGRRRGRWHEYDGISGVYAFASLGTGAVKIGWSDNIAKRMALSAMYCPFGAVVIGVRQTEDSQEEKKVHRDLKKFSLRGEWFVWCDYVKGYLDEHFACETQDASPAAVSGAVSNNPLLEFDEFDAATTAFVKAVQSMPKSSAAYLSQWIDADSAKPLTCEDLVRFASGRFGGITRERYRQHLYNVAYRIMAT